MTFPRDYFDRLSEEEKVVLRKCGLSLDLKEVINMDDQRFYNIIYGDHVELSDHEYDLWLELSTEIKNRRDEVINKKNKIWSTLERESRRNQWSRYDYRSDNGNGKDNNSKVSKLCRDGINIILYDHHLKTMRDNYDQWHYSHRDGIFIPEGEFLIKEVMQSTVGSKLTTKLFNEAKNEIERRSFIKRTAFNNDIKWIATNNCMVNLLTGEIAAFSPDFLCTTKIPVTYNVGYPKDACAYCLRQTEWLCSEIMKFLNDLMNPEDVDLILDFMAYCLWRDYRNNFWLLLHGAGSNGKSTLLRLIQRFLGSDNISSESLDRLLHNQFAVANLYQKLANIDADISPDVILNNTGILKALTGNDLITGEYKFKTAFKFINHAKLIFSCNKIPQTDDDTDAFFRRVLVINFKRQFFDTKDNRNKIDELTTEQELRGLLHELISRIPRIVKHGLRQVTSETMDSTYDKYTESSNPVKYFYEKALASACPFSHWH